MTADFQAISGALASPGITFSSDATSGLYLEAVGDVGLVSKSLGILINSSVFSVSAAAVSAGGSGYVVGDTIVLTGGTAISQAILTVATLSGSAVATVTVSYQGYYSAMPSNPAAQGSTSGLGTGATFTLTATTQYTRSVATREGGGSVWVRLGSSNFIAGLMSIVNGRDFVTALGASNVTTAIGLSAPPPSSYKNLVIKVTTNTALTAVADFVTTTNGTAFLTTALSSTINMATTGANALDTGSIAAATWYAIWAIAKADGTTAALASTSFTAPTMPTGYTYKARIGAVTTAAASAQLMGTWQFGQRAQYIIGLAQTGSTYPTPGTATGAIWQTRSVTAQVPSTASEISGFLTYATTGGTAGTIGVSSNSSVTTFERAQFYNSYFNTNAATNSLAYNMVLEGTAIFVAGANVNSTVTYVTGWMDNL